MLNPSVADDGSGVGHEVSGKMRSLRPWGQLSSSWRGAFGAARVEGRRNAQAGVGDRHAGDLKSRRESNSAQVVEDGGAVTCGMSWPSDQVATTSRYAGADQLSGGRRGGITALGLAFAESLTRIIPPAIRVCAVWSARRIFSGPRLATS